MSYAVQLSEQAEADLRGIFEYIAFDLQSVQNAAAQLSRLEKNIYALDKMPERYRRYDKEPWRSRGLRIMSVDNFCVFYIPNAEKSKVSIVRVMYGGRDIETELAKHTSE
ncbi:MAG: type II toxin-antitoxin system RelE/ParE family toxin [Oscillospiraceae bacterium]|nr:type II toxin-antitoxin system RelE/ParE family toxin [Oscillospiraceae bacterium]